MTIKILSRGTPPKEKTFVTRCRECKSVFTFQGMDIKAGYERNESYFQMTCPVCNFEIFLAELIEAQNDKVSRI